MRRNICILNTESVTPEPAKKISALCLNTESLTPDQLSEKIYARTWIIEVPRWAKRIICHGTTITSVSQPASSQVLDSQGPEFRNIGV